MDLLLSKLQIIKQTLLKYKSFSVRFPIYFKILFLESMPLMGNI